jgi:ZIP family zinc transporter
VPDLWLVALSAAAAAAAATLGVIPVIIAGEVSPRLGWANALAAGLMLGAGYVLLQQGLALSPVGGIAGAVLGITLVFAGHRFTHLTRVDLSRPEDHAAATVSQIVTREALHSAAEGVAIGMGFVVDPRLGLLMAGILGLHNIAEGAAISAALIERGWGPAKAALLSAGVMTTYVPAAVATAAWIGTNARPWGLGFSAGAMFYLILVELMPESYRQRGHTGIAITASAAMSIVVLLHAILVG